MIESSTRQINKKREVKKEEKDTYKSFKIKQSHSQKSNSQKINEFKSPLRSHIIGQSQYSYNDEVTSVDCDKPVSLSHYFNIPPPMHTDKKEDEKAETEPIKETPEYLNSSTIIPTVKKKSYLKSFISPEKIRS